MQNLTIGNFLFWIDFVWFRMLIVLAAVQLELAVSFSFRYFGRFVDQYTTTRFLADVLSTRHFIVKCSQRRTARRLVESLVKVTHETLQCEVFSTEDFKSSLRCFLDGTLQCCEVFSKKVHRVDSYLVCRRSFDETLQDEVFSEKTSDFISRWSSLHYQLFAK